MTYLGALAAQIRSNVAPGVGIPADADSLFLIYAVLLRAKAGDVTLEDVHDAWAAWMELSGKEHRSLVPFEDLAPDVQNQDLPFADAIRRTARAEL